MRPLPVAALAFMASLAQAANLQPPRALGSVSNAVENCYRTHSRMGQVTGEVVVSVSVDEQGRVTGATSPAGTNTVHAAAAQCVAVLMKFEPATQDGEPVTGKVDVTVGFPSPPSLKQEPRRAIEYCQPAIDPRHTLHGAFEGGLDLLVRVGKDGRVAETVLPDGVLPWMADAAQCVAERLAFFPARLRLVAIESWAMVPIDFNLSRDPHERPRIETPTVRSDDAEILEAYRKCYPAGQNAEALVNYRITISEGGRVRKAEVVRSSGDVALDDAGVCILRRLVFVPTRRNGVNVKATINWPILVRPPT